MIKDDRLVFGATANLDPHYTEIVARRYNNPKANLLVAIMPSLPVGQIVPRAQAAPDQAYLTNPLYQDCFRPHRMRHVAVGCLLRDNGLVMPCGVLRSDRRNVLTEEEMRLLNLFALHMRHAADIMLRTNALDAQRQAGEAALDLLPVGILLVSEARRVLFANRAALDIIAAHDGLDVRHGELVTATPRETRALNETLARCVATVAGHGMAGGGCLTISRPSMAVPLSALVTPFAGPIGGGVQRPAAVVFVSDPERAIRPMAEALQDGFGLSRAESALLSLLVRGRDLNEAAADLGIAVTTARTHLAHIFSKMGTSRQSDLIRRVVDSAVWIASRTP